MRTLVVLLLAAACGGSSAPPDDVTLEAFLVPGVAPPANPVTGAETPAALNAMRVLRYRQKSAPPTEIVILAMPGLLAGAQSFDPLARALVRRGAAAGRGVEVWALDRRANLLEDPGGLDAAEAASDAEVATRYYFGGGSGFAGFKAQADVPFASEWGLATHVGDLLQVLALIPEAEQKRRVFLLGHSLGGSFAEAFASWELDDGSQGSDHLAGLILADGALGGTPLSETAYLEGTSGGAFPRPGLTKIREQTRYVEIPLFGVQALVRAEILGARVLYAPGQILEDSDRDFLLGLALGLSPLPRMTNRAALGFAFDREFSPLSFISTGVGKATGGPVTPYRNAIAGTDLVHPSDADATYDFDDAPQTGEYSDLETLARALAEGPSDLIEWYHPARLGLDLSAVGNAALDGTSWQVATYGLRVTRRATMDAPVLALPAALNPERYPGLAERMGPAVGADRPHAGATRADGVGLVRVDATLLGHLDVLVARDEAANPVPAAIMTFVLENGPTGGSITVTP